MEPHYNEVRGLRYSEDPVVITNYLVNSKVFVIAG